MRWVKWSVAVAAFLFMIYACALPGDLAVGTDTEGGLPGIYTVNGVDPVDTEYSGTLVINGTDHPEVFDVEWIVTGAIQIGVGVRDGNRLTVEWTEVNNATGDGTGPISYEITDNGELLGFWQAEGFEQPGSERAFPQP